MFCYATLVALGGLLLGQTGTGTQAVFDDFFAWWKQQPSEIRNSFRFYSGPYRELLKSRGLSDADADTRLKLIETQIFTHPEFSEALYDSRFSSSKPVYNEAPNAFVSRIAAQLKPGRALDVQMGQGRNALHLAAKGWNVTGFDISGEGVRSTLKAADQRGLKISAVQADHREFQYGEGSWDLIVLSYPWIPFSDRETYQKILRSLKPGGSLVYEHFLNTSKDERQGHLPAANQLLREFSGLHIVFYEETTAEADWSVGTESQVVRLHARKD
jgi:SAM-dependent methyltransferase